MFSLKLIRGPVLMGWLDSRISDEVAQQIVESLNGYPPMRAALDISPDEVGRIMHESWSKTKRAQGFHGPDEPCDFKYPPIYCFGEHSLEYPFGAGTRNRCTHFHPDLIPWEDLPQGQQDLNLHAFDDVLAEIRRRTGVEA